MRVPCARWAAPLLAALVISSGVSAGAEPKAGAIDLARLKCVGNQTFATDKITAALCGDLEWAAAESSRMPQAARLKLLEERVARGYANAGFHEAEITAERQGESNQVTLHIDEGPRCLMGEVRIEGAGPIPVERLVECLTQPTANPAAVRSVVRELNGVSAPQWFDKDGKPLKPISPLWTKGKPLRIERNIRRPGRKIARQALDDLGYRNAEFEVAVERAPQAQTATLVMKLTSVGPPSIVNAIEVTGLNKNTREALLDYLELREGVLFTRAEQLRIEQSLWRSARFLYYAVKLSDNAADGTRGLRIDLEESEFAPPLGEPLSVEDTALINLRDWLATFSQRDLDAMIEVQVPKSNTRMVVSPRHGVILRITTEGRLLDQFSLAPQAWPIGLGSLIAQLAPAAATGLDQAIVLTDQQIGIYNLQQGHRFVGAPIQVTAGVSFEASPLRIADRNAQRLNQFQFGAFYRSRDTDDQPRPPFEFSMQLSPASFLMEGRRPNSKLELVDGILNYSYSGLQIRTQAATGELLEYSYSGANNTRCRITFEPGAYAGQVAELAQRSAEHPNLFDANRWATSLVKYLATDDLLPNLLDIGRFTPRVMGLMSKALDNDVLAPLDRLSLKSSNSPDDFGIVPDYTDTPLEYSQKLAAELYPYGRELFADHTWPSDLWRQMALAAGGKRVEATQELANYYDNDNNGPLAFLAAGAISQLTHAGQERRCATRAQARLSTTAFRRDCQAIWSGRTAFSETLANLSKTIAELNEDEASIVCQQIPKPWNDVARDFAASLRKKSQRKPLDALEDAAAEAWEATIRDRASDYLWSVISASP